MNETTPRFVQGVFAFTGRGYRQPLPIEIPPYVVPENKRSQLIYLRAGNSSSELIFLALHQDGKLMRYFPVGARASEHVSLAVIEDLRPGAKLEVLLGAPQGAVGTVVLDIGLIEI